jgi:replicative DNA helicase
MSNKPELSIVDPNAAQAAAQSTSLNPRLAPQDQAAERSVLGGILLLNSAIFDVLEVVRAEDFYRDPHRKIFAAMVALANRNEPIDVIMLTDELRRRGDLEAVGGMPYLASLDSSVPATSNLSNYAKIVRDEALARRVIETAHQIARDGYERSMDVATFVDRAEQRLFDVTNGRESSSFEALGPSVTRTFKLLETNYERQSDITGLSTGFADLDQLLAGLQPADFILLAARPSMGKTALMMQICDHVAIEQKLPVAVFSLEMKRDALTQRMLANRAKIDGQRVRTGKLLDSDWPKLAKAADAMFRAPLFIDDGGGQTVMEMRGKCRRLKARHPKLALVAVDYLQLIRGTNPNNREQEISEISRGLKGLAKDLDVPVIALSQLNRDCEKRADKRPQLSDLRESGSLEQDADVIAFIYRDEVYDKNTKDKGVAEVIIRKQRNGPTDTVSVAYQREYTRFETLDPKRGGTWG